MDVPYIRIVSLSPVEALNLLKQCSPQFNPPLNASMDLEQYANKLSQFASFLTYSVSDKIIGFIAFYPNQLTSIAYIPLVWVDERFRGNGIAKAMFLTFFDHCKSAGFRYSELEVLKNNTAAVSLYHQLGYKFREDHQSKNLLRATINSDEF